MADISNANHKTTSGRIEGQTLSISLRGNWTPPELGMFKIHVDTGRAKNERCGASAPVMMSMGATRVHQPLLLKLRQYARLCLRHPTYLLRG